MNEMNSRPKKPSIKMIVIPCVLTLTYCVLAVMSTIPVMKFIFYTMEAVSIMTQIWYFRRYSQEMIKYNIDVFNWAMSSIFNPDAMNERIHRAHLSLNDPMKTAEKEEP